METKVTSQFCLTIWVDSISTSQYRQPWDKTKTRYKLWTARKFQKCIAAGFPDNFVSQKGHLFVFSQMLTAHGTHAPAWLQGLKHARCFKVDLPSVFRPFFLVEELPSSPSKQIEQLDFCCWCDCDDFSRSFACCSFMVPVSSFSNSAFCFAMSFFSLYRHCVFCFSLSTAWKTYLGYCKCKYIMW